MPRREIGQLRLLLGHRFWCWLALLSSCYVLSLATSSFVVRAGQQTSSAQVSVSGQVPGQPPSEALSFASPANNSQFQTNPVTLTGNCTPQLVIQFFRNGDFAGSAFCANDATFQFQLDLAAGKNIIIGRQYDGLGQAGPASAALTLYLLSTASSSTVTALPNGMNGAASTASQLQLIVPANLLSGYVNQPVTTTVRINGGTPPYALSAQWGDGHELLLSRTGGDQLAVGHEYQRAGDYTLVLHASDSQQQTAQLQLAVRIGGPGGGVASGASGPHSLGWWRQLATRWWPLAAAGCILIAAALLWWRQRRRLRLLTAVSYPQMP